MKFVLMLIKRYLTTCYGGIRRRFNSEYNANVSPISGQEVNLQFPASSGIDTITRSGNSALSVVERVYSNHLTVPKHEKNQNQKGNNRTSFISKDTSKKATGALSADRFSRINSFDKKGVSIKHSPITKKSSQEARVLKVCTKKCSFSRKMSDKLKVRKDSNKSRDGKCKKKFTSPENQSPNMTISHNGNS